ncbi:MAG: hypothetical protein WCV90_08670 [Candidatus Woesearchaeota archaeon]
MTSDGNVSLESLTLLRVYTVRNAPEAELRTVYADQDFMKIDAISREGVSYDTFTVNHLPPEADIPQEINLFPTELKPGQVFRAANAVEVVSYTVVPADAIDDLVAVYLGAVDLHAARKGVIDEKERRYQAEIAGLREGLAPVPGIPELLKLNPELQGDAYTTSLDELTRQTAALYLTARITEKLGAGPVIPRPVPGEDPEVRLANVLEVYRKNTLLRTVVEFSGDDLTLFKSRSGQNYTMDKQGGIIVAINPDAFRSVLQSSEIAECMLEDGLTTSREAARQMENQVRNYLNGLIQAAK